MLLADYEHAREGGDYPIVMQLAYAGALEYARVILSTASASIAHRIRQQKIVEFVTCCRHPCSQT